MQQYFRSRSASPVFRFICSPADCMTLRFSVYRYHRDFRHSRIAARRIPVLPSSMAQAPKTQFLKSAHNDGQVTAYRVYDKRSGRSTTPLVMIQGLSAVGTVDYHDLAQSLSKSRTVVSLDNRDIGESTWQSEPKPFTLEDLAWDVAHLIQVSQYSS